MLKKELRLQLQELVFWTDSTSVLKYVMNEDKRFHTFVANRVSIIREATKTSPWLYVGTKENPADDASRGRRSGDFIKNRGVQTTARYHFCGSLRGIFKNDRNLQRWANYGRFHPAREAVGPK